MARNFSADPKFEDVYRQHEFSPLVGLTLLLADRIGRFLRKPNAAATNRISREQDTLHRDVAPAGANAPRATLAANDRPNGPTR